MVMFMPKVEETLLMGFSSCRRFSGEFWFNEKEIQIVLNLEGIEILPGETVELESLFMSFGERNTLLEEFASRIAKKHPRLPWEEAPTGWCSWLVYGPDVTAQNIYDNMAGIKERHLNLKYVQIDDGYQAHMGDWLTTADTFEGGIKKMCLDIKEQGFEPAIWVAPFIAEERSEVFQNHPDWFVKDDNGKPLPSNKVSFGGWRCGPWYMLDATHPEARRHLTNVFRTMRKEWQVTYFKMDANMWGALPFGHRYEKNKTCVEAYRMGMEAIIEGAGEDSFLFGCNAPMWPSLGVVHGMRITNDNLRSFEQFSALARECFPRNWQNYRLWINDPDTIVQQNREIMVCDPNGEEKAINTGLSREEFLFNAAYTLASGGMVLSGDDVTELTEQNCDELQRILNSQRKSAVFEDLDHTVGRISLDGEEIVCIFNREDSARTFTVAIKEPVKMTDFWSDREMGVCKEPAAEFTLERHSALVLRMTSLSK